MNLKNNIGAEKILNDSPSTNSSVICSNDDCDALIPVERLKAIPGTTVCVRCASSRPFTKQRVQETWGTREDYKKDRQSWAPWKNK
jgi:hypothetical protein